MTAETNVQGMCQDVQDCHFILLDYISSYVCRFLNSNHLILILKRRRYNTELLKPQLSFLKSKDSIIHGNVVAWNDLWPVTVCMTINIEEEVMTCNVALENTKCVFFVWQQRRDK